VFEESVKLIDSGAYLGDIKVVSKLVGQFINDVAVNRSANGIFSAINRNADIFLGLDDSYAPVPGWNTNDQLGRVLARRLSVSYEQAGVDVFRTAFGEFACMALGIVKASAGKSDEELQKETEALMKYMVFVLIGNADTLYPNDKSWK
jgi:hypothetical protein